MKNVISWLIEDQKQLLHYMPHDKLFGDEFHRLLARAILAELGELMESIGFKWWQYNERDENNIYMELADILQFLLTGLCVYHIKNNEDPIVFADILENIINDDYHTTGDDILYARHLQSPLSLKPRCFSTWIQRPLNNISYDYPIN